MSEHEARAILTLHRRFPGLVREDAVYEALIVLAEYRQVAA